MRKVRWFRRKRSEIPQGPIEYPYGLCVKTEKGYFLIRNKTRLRIPTERVFNSWNFNAINTSEIALKYFPIASKIGFRDGTLIQNMVGGNVYLISHNKKRLISNPDTIEKYGLDWNSIVIVSSEEAKLHEDGEVLS